MRTRNVRVRTKVAPLHLSLVARWSLAAYVTVRDGINLRRVGTLDRPIGQPTDALIAALQKERRLSLDLTTGSDTDPQALEAQRRETDGVTALRSSAGTGLSRLAEGATAAQRLRDTEAGLDKLARYRQTINGRALDGTTAANWYSDITDAGFGVLGSLYAPHDQDIAEQSRAITALNWAREPAAREDAALACGRFTGGHRLRAAGSGRSCRRSRMERGAAGRTR